MNRLNLDTDCARRSDLSFAIYPLYSVSTTTMSSPKTHPSQTTSKRTVCPFRYARTFKAKFQANNSLAAFHLIRQKVYALGPVWLVEDDVGITSEVR